MSDSPEDLERLRQIVGQMTTGTPHARALGIELVDVSRGRAWAKVTPRPELIGDPETGVIAGGVITALLDQICGAAAMTALEVATSIATLDLRIDYMRPAAPDQPVLAMAHCYKLTRSVAFVRAVAYETEPDDPIANATAAFMLASNAGRKFGANTKPPS